MAQDCIQPFMTILGVCCNSSDPCLGPHTSYILWHRSVPQWLRIASDPSLLYQARCCNSSDPCPDPRTSYGLMQCRNGSHPYVDVLHQALGDNIDIGAAMARIPMSMLHVYKVVWKQCRNGSHPYVDALRSIP